VEKIVFTSTSNADLAHAAAAEILIPAIRTAATISLAIAPCSLGFVVIAVSEQLIRSIMVGDDPVMLVSDLQNQFPNNAIEIDENHDPGLVAKVLELLEYLDQALGLPAWPLAPIICASARGVQDNEHRHPGSGPSGRVPA
jgi:hypothetical protein